MFEWKFHFWQCEITLDMDICSDLFHEWFFFQLFDSHYYYFLIFYFHSLLNILKTLLVNICPICFHYYFFYYVWFNLSFPISPWLEKMFFFLFILSHSSLFHFPQSKSSYSYFSLNYFHYFYQEKRRMTMAQAAKVRNGQWDKKVQDGSRRRKVKSK